MNPHCCADGWICEAHSDRPWPHDDCAGPGTPCPQCNHTNPPRLPIDWESFISAGIATASPREPELLFEFVCESDRALMACYLKFRGESYGWEAQFLAGGDLFCSRGAFVTRALAMQWAELERMELEKGGA